MERSCSAPLYHCAYQALFVLVVVVTVGVVEGQQRVIVPTKQGLVQGFNADGINYFLGVPYAAPPTGKLRWKPPQSVTPWVGVREAVSYGNSFYECQIRLDSNSILLINLLQSAWVHAKSSKRGSTNI